MIGSVEYVFPKLEYPFMSLGYEYKFLPEIEVRYVGSAFPEYHTLSRPYGRYGTKYRRVLLSYPFITIRVIEPIEFNRIIGNVTESGIDLKSLIAEAKTIE